MLLIVITVASNTPPVNTVFFTHITPRLQALNKKKLNLGIKQSPCTIQPVLQKPQQDRSPAGNSILHLFQPILN